MKKLCRKHRTYKAIHKPRVRCAQCWKAYVKLNPHEILSEKDKNEMTVSLFKDLDEILESVSK